MTREQRFRAVGLFLFIAVCFVIASYYFSLAGTNLIPGGSAYTVQAVVPSAVSLAPAADVREAGVNIGKVNQISASGSGTLLKLQLDSHAPVYRDAQVFLRAKTIAGENYVELTPGTPQAGAVPSGGMLGLNNAQDATQIDQIFSVFNQARRADLQRALYGLGTGLSDGGASLNRTLEAATALPGQGSPAAQILAKDGTQLGSLVNTFGTVTRALGDRAAGIRTLTTRIKVAAVAVAQRDAQLRAVLDQLPPFLQQANITAARLRTFSISATPVVHNLRIAAQDLVPTVQVLLPAAREGQSTVQQLGRFAVAAKPAMTQLRPFAEKATTFVPPLETFVREVRPMVGYLSPFGREISTFFALTASSFESTDALGHVARITLPVSRSDLAGVLTPAEDALLTKLDGSFDARGNNAYPSPGNAGHSIPYSGTYPQLAADPPYSH
jgi:phospholipid/cholesterol/gamma-HCH transport system substrate-binding protein